MNPTIGYTIVQGVVTAGLLVIAYLLRTDAHVTDLILGAVTSTWLREAVYLGQAAGGGRASPPVAVSPSPPAAGTTTGTTPPAPAPVEAAAGGVTLPATPGTGV